MARLHAIAESIARMGAYGGVLRDAILATKYTAWRRVGQELGTDLGAVVADALK